MSNKNVKFLSEKRSSNNTVDEAIEKANRILSNCGLSKILEQNKYEKLIPFNLWFKNDKYSIVPFNQNNQFLRIRYYNNIMLTPLVSRGENLKAISKLIPSMTLYQPFYPEKFYYFWECLQHKYLDFPINNSLFISKEEHLGSLEAFILYQERYNFKSTYDCWISGDEKMNLDKLIFGKLSVDFLGQAYRVNYLESSDQVNNYDFVYIDCINRFENIFEWATEEMDLQATLFYFLFILKYINKGGSMIVRLNLNMSSSWNIIFDLAKKYFKEYTFFRSNIINPFNPEVYLFLSKYKEKEIDRSEHLIQNLYLQKAYELFHCNMIFNESNNILKDFSLFQETWISGISKCSLNLKKSIKSLPLDNILDDWCIKNDFKQIKDLSDNLNPNPLILDITTSSKSFTLKMETSDDLMHSPFYRNLIKKKCELNFYKRVMDTKPSNIFMESRYSNQELFLLTWEELSASIDYFSNLKSILKKEYNAEMVTNAWIKMYEMIDLFSTSGNVFRTFNICEGPGAFIACINHATFNKGIDFEWHAQTLRPDDQQTNNALDDHFGLITSYPDHWVFGDPQIDDSGDITHNAVIKNYASLSFMENIDFITADGGIKCDPIELNEQEEKLTKINMGQIVCILACLPINKSALFKTFIPMTEPLTISMMYLLTHLFESIQIMKPSTSHSSNSEVYIILKNYKGIKKEILDILYELLDDPKVTSKTLLFDIHDKEFMNSYLKSINSLVDRQIQSLIRSFYYYYNMDKTSEISDLSEDWLKRHKIRPLERFLLA